MSQNEHQYLCLNYKLSCKFPFASSRRLLQPNGSSLQQRTEIIPQRLTSFDLLASLTRLVALVMSDLAADGAPFSSRCS